MLLIGLMNGVALCAESGDAIVATWDQGAVTRSEYASWLQFHGLEDSPETILELVYVRSMAAISEQRVASSDSRLRLELESAEHKVLLPVLKEQVEASARVTDEEIESLRKEHPEAFVRPAKVHLRSIFKELGPDDDASVVRAGMTAILDQLRAGADFAELARKESQSQTRFRGGDVGFVDPAKLPVAVAEAVRTLAPGELSEVVEHSGGVSVFQCLEWRDGVVPSPDEVREKLRANLMRQRRKEAWTSFQAALEAALEPHTKPEDAETVLELDGYRLSADAFAELVRMSTKETQHEALSPEQRRELLRRWGAMVLAVRRARDIGLAATPEIAEELAWRRLDVLARAELVRRVDERLSEASETEMRRHFEENPGRYRKAPAFEIAVIQFATDDADLREEGVATAREVVRRIDLGEIGFDEAARRYSLHSSASHGGYLGWLEQGRIAGWGPVASKGIRAMQPGQNSGLLHLDTGLWLFELRGRRETRAASFDEAREQVRAEIKKERVGELEGEVRAEQLAAIKPMLRPVT